MNTYPHMNMEQTECSEMLAFKLQTPANHPAESMQQSAQGESLKSRKVLVSRRFKIRQGTKHPVWQRRIQEERILPNAAKI
jgi:hypothetical protein